MRTCRGDAGTENADRPDLEADDFAVMPDVLLGIRTTEGKCMVSHHKVKQSNR